MTQIPTEIVYTGNLATIHSYNGPSQDTCNPIPKFQWLSPPRNHVTAFWVLGNWPIFMAVCNNLWSCVLFCFVFAVSWRLLLVFPPKKRAPIANSGFANNHCKKKKGHKIGCDHTMYLLNTGTIYDRNSRVKFDHKSKITCYVCMFFLKTERNSNTKSLLTAIL